MTNENVENQREVDHKMMYALRDWLQNDAVRFSRVVSALMADLVSPVSGNEWVKAQDKIQELTKRLDINAQHVVYLNKRYEQMMAEFQGLTVERDTLASALHEVTNRANRTTQPPDTTSDDVLDRRLAAIEVRLASVELSSQFPLHVVALGKACLMCGDPEGHQGGECPSIQRCGSGGSKIRAEGCTCRPFFANPDMSDYNPDCPVHGVVRG